MDKNKRWRLKMQSQGRCTRCGKPAAPYGRCENHRKLQKIWFKNNKSEKMTDTYIKDILLQSMCKDILLRDEIPQSLIDIKRQELTVLRYSLNIHKKLKEIGL